MDTRRKISKWGFGMAPISATMQGRYDYAVQSMIDFLEGNTAIEEIEPNQISELKGMFNRCLRKDQWDWLSVFARFGSPKKQSLTPLIPLLIDLRRSVILGETQRVESISQRLLQLDLLRLLQTFQNASYSKSNNTECMTREEATRRIDEAAEEKLTELDLSGLELKELPSEILKCTHLTGFSFNSNRITSIPEMIAQLSNLTNLSFGNNQITSIPEVIGELSNLTELILGDNKITSIPEVIEQLSNLTLLDLGNNQITSIPEALGQLSNLKYLNLTNNQINSISEALGQLSNLTLLDLGKNQITSIPETLGQLSSLTGLFLGDNKITTIPEVIGQLSNLKELLLPNNQIAEIPEAIRSMKNLENLDLRGNPVPIPPQVLGYGQDLGGCGDLQTILDSYFHTRNPALPELDAERQKIEAEGYFDAETSGGDNETKVLAL